MARRNLARQNQLQAGVEALRDLRCAAECRGSRGPARGARPPARSAAGRPPSAAPGRRRTSRAPARSSGCGSWQHETVEHLPERRRVDLIETVVERLPLGRGFRLDDERSSFVHLGLPWTRRTARRRDGSRSSDRRRRRRRWRATVSRPDMDAHGSDSFDGGDDLVAGLDGADAFGRAGEDDVAGIAACRTTTPARSARATPRINRLVFDFCRCSPLTAIWRSSCPGFGISSAVTSHGPSTECVSDGLAEAAILGPANRDVEADRVARDVVERIALATRGSRSCR